MAEALSAGAMIRNIVTRLPGIAQSLKDTEAAKTISNLQKDLQELDREIDKLREENESLKKQLVGEYELRDGAFFLKNPGGRTVGPYCTTCHGKDNKAILLQETPHNTTKYHCRTCKGNFGQNDRSGMPNVIQRSPVPGARRRHF